ncbi:IQ domain-containing protein N isoform X13 [Mustela erminea]|uniref:IQ domain-containing protein N isoform X13 n=1 Tax=Mustela erminea TaxID=36723 RepID=UPI0013870D69|nr:IQ domain-containing protein N isoform X13 [Mustela erminea]
MALQELTRPETKTMQEAAQLPSSTDGQNVYQPQSVSSLQDKAGTLSPQLQHEPVESRETFLQQHDKDVTVPRHIPRLRAVVESQAFKNVLVDEMDMMLSRAATLIQANWRGYRLRQKLISQMKAAKAIQEAWRRFNTRRLLRSGKTVEKKVSVDEGDIPYHAPQQVRFQPPGEVKPPVAQPVMVSKETQFPSSDNLDTCTHQLALLQAQGGPQPGMQAPGSTGGPSVTFLPHQTIAIRLPCPVNLDAKCHPCLMTRTVRNACLVHVEGDMVKTKQVTTRANKAGAPGPPPCGRYAQAVHGSLKTQTQGHVETEVLKAPPQTGPALVINKTAPQMYPVTTMTKTPPQPCAAAPMVTIAKTPPQVYPAARMTKTSTQMNPAAAVTKTPPQPYPAVAMPKSPLQSCLAAMMSKTLPPPCSAPTVTITKASPHTYPVAPMAKSPPQTCPVAPIAKASPQTSQPATMIKTPLQSGLGGMANKTPTQPCPVAPMSKTPTQMRPTASMTNASPQTRPAAMMAKISPHICLLASMIKPQTQTRPMATMGKAPPQTCPVPTMAKTLAQMRPAAPMTKTPLQTCPAAAMAKTPSQMLPGTSVTKTPPQTRLAAMVTKTPAQFRSMAAILKTLCLPPSAAGNLKSSPPATVASGIPNASSRTCLNGPKAKAMVNAKQTTGMVRVSSHSYLAEGKVKYFNAPHLGAGTPKAPARPPLEAERMKAFSQKQVKMETVSSSSVAIEMSRASPWVKMAEDRNKSLLQTCPRADVVKVQSQVYVPMETAVVLPRAQLAPCPTKVPPQTHLETCLAKGLPQEQLATCTTTASSQEQLLAELTAALPQAHPGTCLSKTLSQAHPPTKLTPTQAQAHPGTCLSKALSQAHPPAKLTKTPSFAHLGTCLTKVQSRAHLASRVIKVQSKAHLSTELTKAQSQAQLVTETAKCLYTAQHSAELSGKTQSQPLLAGFKVSTQPCKHTGALGNLPRAKPEDRLTQIQPHSYVQGKGTQGPSQGPCETKSMLVPLAASAGHPTCNVESWGDSGATRAQSPMPGPATPCPEELAASQLASLCAELAAELGSQEDLRALLTKALSQGQVRAALNQALSKKALGSTMAKALPQGKLGTALMKVLSWGELGLALSRTLSPGELRAELTKAKQGKLADVLSKALTEEEWAALSQALCQGELGAVLSQSLSQAALRTGVVLPKATSKTAGSRMSVIPAPVEVDCRGNPAAAWGSAVGPVRPQPSKVRVPQDGAWEGFFTGWPAGFLEEMGDGAMLGGSPCSPVVSVGASLASRVISAIHQHPLIAALDPSRGGGSDLHLNPAVSEENVRLPPGASELASDLNPVESDTGPSLPKPPHLQPPSSLWQPLIANGVGPSTSQQSVVAGGTAPSSHSPHAVSRVAPRPWVSSGEGRAASGVRVGAAGRGSTAHSHQCAAAYGGSVCWCQYPGVNKVPSSMYRASTKARRQPSVLQEETMQKTQSPNHKRASVDTRERINKATPGALRGASGSKVSLSQPQTPKTGDTTLGLLPNSMAPGHRWALKTQAEAGMFPASPGSRSARTLSRTAIPRQERTRTLGTNAGVRCAPEQGTGHILNEVASLAQSPDNDMAGSLSQGSTDYGPNVSNSQSSLPSGSSPSPSTMSVASLTAGDLVEEESWEASFDTVLSGEAVGSPQRPRGREKTKRGGRGHRSPNPYPQPSAGSELIPILHHSSVSGRMTLSVHWGSDDQEERDESSGQSSMGLTETLPQKSYRMGLTKSLSLDNVVPTMYQQPSAASRLTSSLSQPLVVSKVAPNPGQPSVVSKVTTSPSELSMASKVIPSLTEPSVCNTVNLGLDQKSWTSQMNPSLAQPYMTGGVATNLVQPSVTGEVAPSLAQPSGTHGLAPNLAQTSMTNALAPSLTQPPVTGRVAPSLAQASVTSGVAPSLAWGSVTGGVAPSLAQASMTDGVAPSLARPSVTSGVASSLAQASLTGVVAPSLARASVTSGVAPSLARASVTGGVAPSLVQASMTSGVAPSLARPSVTGGVAPSLAQASMTSGVAPSLARPSVTGGVAPSLPQASMTGVVAPSLARLSVTSGVAPNLARASMTSGVASNLAQASVTGGVAPSLARLSVTSGVAPSLAQPPVTSVVAPSLDQASMTSGVVPSLARVSVTSGVAPSLAWPSVTGGVVPSLAQASMTGGVAPSLAQASMTGGVSPSLAQPSVTGGVSPSLAQASMTGGVAPSRAQTSMTSGVVPSLVRPSVTGGVSPSLAQASVTSGVSPSLAQASVTGGVSPSLAQASVTGGGSPSLAQASMTGGVSPSLTQASVTGRVSPSLPQASVTGGVAPRLAQPSVSSGVMPSLAKPCVADAMTPSLTKPSMTDGEGPTIAQPSVTGGVTPSLAQAPVACVVAPSLHQPSVTSGEAPSLGQSSVACVVAPSLAPPSGPCVVVSSLGPPPMTGGVAPSLAQSFVANRGPLSLFQPSVIAGTNCAAGQSGWAPKVGSNLPSRVSAVAPSLGHPSLVTEVPLSSSYSYAASSTSRDLSQSPVATSMAPCQDPVMVDGVAPNPQAHEFSQVSLTFHQPLGVSRGHPSITEHSALPLSAPNLFQASGASGEDSCLDQGTNPCPGSLFPGVPTGIGLGTMAAGMFPNMSRGTLAAGMFLSMSPGSLSPGMTGSVCQRSVATGMGPNQFQEARGVDPRASLASGAGAPLIHEQASEVGPGFSRASVPNRLGTSPIKFSQADAGPSMSQVNVDLPISLNQQHPSVATIVAPGYEQAKDFNQEPVVDTASGLVPGSVPSRMTTAMAPGTVASGTAPSLAPGSVIRGMGQSLPPGSVISGVPPHLPPGFVVSGVPQNLPEGSVIYGISHSLPPGSVISGMGQGLPPDPVASAVAQNFPPGSVASGMPPSLIATSGAGGKGQSFVRPSFSLTVPNLISGSAAGGMVPGVSARPVTSSVVPAIDSGELNQGLILESTDNVAGLPSTVGNVAQSLPQGSMLIGITPRPYHGAPAREGSTAPFQGSHVTGLAQLHPQALEASSTTRRVHRAPTVLQRATQLSHALEMMSFETTDDQVIRKPDDLSQAVSRASVSSAESMVLDATPWMPQNPPSADVSHSHSHSQQFFPDVQRPLLEMVPSQTKSLTSGMAPVPPQSLSFAKPSMAGNITPTLLPRSATSWGAPSSHFVTASTASSVHIESVKAVGAPLARRASVAHIVPQSPSVTHVVPQGHPHKMGASPVASASPKLAQSRSRTFSVHPGSVVGVGTPTTSQKSGTTYKASQVLYPPTAGGVGSDGFQVDVVPRAHKKPAPEDLAQSSHKSLGSRKSYRSVHDYLVSDMLDSNVARVVPLYDVQEQVPRSSQESPGHAESTPPAVTPIIRTMDMAPNVAAPRLHQGFRRVSLGYESSPDGSRRPLFTPESTPGSWDFQSAVVPSGCRRVSLTPTVLQGPVDAGIAGGQAWNSAAIPSGAAGPTTSAMAPGGAWDLARASEPWDTVGRETAVDSKQSGEQVASLQAVEKVVTRAVVTIQACARGYLVRRTIRVWHQWAVIIQAAWRGYRVRRDLARLSQAATTIQATWRGFRARRIETQLQLLPGGWTKADDRTKSTSDHRCFQSCQPRVCPFCQSLSPSLGSPPSVVMLVGSSPRTCHMCGHTLPTRVVHGMGRGSRVQASMPGGCDSPMASQSSQQSHLQNKAATTIQSAWRGFAVRRQLRQQQMAAKMLQANWRGHHTRVGLTPDALLGAAAWDNPEDMQWPGV